MKEKTPRNPILVLATILFLSLFIILPPVFRKFIPRDDGPKEPEVVHSSLYCERISVSENVKVTMKISYENSVAVQNVLTFLSYTPTTDEILSDKGELLGMTIAQEINFFRTVSGVDMEENSSQTVIRITKQTVENNPEKVQLATYLNEMPQTIEYFNGLGFKCSKQEN